MTHGKLQRSKIKIVIANLVVVYEHKMKIMGMDLGKINTAIVILDGSKCCYANMFENTIKDLRDTNQHKRFFISLKTLMKKEKPNDIIAERFAVRTFGTGLIELISVMVGGILSIAHSLKIPCQAILAVTWKSKIKKKADLEKLYEAGEAILLPRHIIDALLMAMYLKDNNSFSNFTIKQFNSYIKQASKLIERKYLLKPKRRKHGMSTSKKQRSKR